MKQFNRRIVAALLAVLMLCSNQTYALAATEETENGAAAVAQTAFDPWLGKLVSFKSSYPYLWSDPSNVNSQILTDAKNLPEKMRVVDSYAFSQSLTLYKLEAADGSQWPTDYAAYTWVDAKYLQILEVEPENPCGCCESCAGQEACQCLCGNCQFCQPEDSIVQLQDQTTGVAVIAQTLPGDASLVVKSADVSGQLSQFGVPAGKQVFGLDISLQTGENSNYQPQDYVMVKVPVSAPAGTIIGILHTHNGKTTLLDVTKVQSDGTVEFVTDGFSGFAGFTVDFHYNGIDYSIDGMKSIFLSKLFAEMKINEDASKATSVVFSDPTLVQVTKEGNDWLLTSLAAFRTNETLVITFADSHVIVIDVTDVDRFINYFGGVVRMETDGSTPPTQAINYTYRRVNGSESTEEVDYYILQIKSSTRILRDGYWFNIYEQKGVDIDNSGNESLISVAATAALKKNRIIKFQEYSTAITLSNSVSGVNASSICTVSVHPRVSIQSLATRNVVVRLNNTQIGYANGVLFPNRNQTSNGWDQYNGLVVNYDSSKYFITTNTYSVGTVPYAYSGGDNGTYTINLYSRYAVAFNANGGSGSMGNQAFIWGTAQNLNANAFTTPTFTVSYNTNGGTAVGNASSSTKFAGWATSATGGVVYSNQQSVNNLTSTAGGTYNLYAKWAATSSVTLPSTSTVTKQGYTLEGWYTDAALTTKAGAPGTSYTPSGTITLYAKWTPNTNTPYTVKHYQQNLNDSNYTEVTADRQTLTGTTGQSTNAVAKNYAGFTAQTFSQSTIAADGSTVISIYYNRNSYTVTVNKGSNVSSVSGGGTYKYGATVTINATVPVGYSWVNWTGYNTQTAQSYTFTMPAGNVTYTANAAPSTNTAYTVKHYQQNLNDSNYTEVTADRQTLTGTTGQSTNAVAKSYTGFTAQSFSQTTIAADGSTVVSIYYNRNSYTVTVNKGSNVSSVSGGGTYKYGATVTINATVPVGYSWVNWTGYSTQTAQSYTFTMPASNVTYTANARINAYKVTYQYTGTVPAGAPAVPAATTRNYQDTVTLAAVPTLNGYTFSGWSTTDATISGGQFTMPNKAVTLSGSWTVNTYTATFVYDNGQANSSVSYATNGTISLPTPSRTGFDFVGWTVTTAAGNWTSGGSYTGTTTAGKYGNVTFTAQWKEREDTVYTVKHYQQNLADNNYTEVTADRQTLQGKTGAQITPAVKTYVGFTSPDAQTTSILADGTRVVSYYYTRNSYTVTVNQGTGISGVTGGGTYKYGATVTINAAVNAGYIWENWTGSSTQTAQSYTFTMPASNVTYTANARINAYKVTYQYTGTVPAGAPAVPAATTKNYQDTVTLAAVPTLNGYTFSGWTTADATISDGQFTMPAKAVTLTGSWIPNTYTATFYYQDGREDVTVGYSVGSAFNLHEPTRTGYDFEGWMVITTDGSWNVGDTYRETAPAGQYGNVTFSAQWELIHYDVVYDLCGGQVDMENPEQYNIHSDDFTLYNPSRIGYLFDGWVGSNGTVPQTSVTIQTGSTEDRHYTAKWTPISYTVKFDGNGATSGSMAEQAFVYDAAQTLRPNAFALEYTVSFHTDGGENLENAVASAAFGGWTTLASAAAGYEDEELVSNLTATHGDEITLYAVWSPAAIKLPLPTKPAYRFTGWYTEEGELVGLAGADYVPAEDITLYARWERATFTITFDTDGGSQILPITLDAGAAVPEITPPTKKNARFVGWSPELPATMPEQDITLTAMWEYAETLTISATGNSNETFLFTVRDTKGQVDMTVSVVGGQSVTIGGLYSDIYTVTEVDNWSWCRGTVASQTVVITAVDNRTDNQAAFTMPAGISRWLHSENHS